MIAVDYGSGADVDKVDHSNHDGSGVTVVSDKFGRVGWLLFVSRWPD